jgi:hypothetical protein
MNCWKTLLSIAMLLTVAPVAMGETQESKERAAKKACLLGEVDKGAEILADLYVDTNDATYIYNQGRCFEQNGKNAQAVLRFKEYLRKAKNLKPEEREATLKKIEALQSPTDQRETQAGAAPSAGTAGQPGSATIANPPASLADPGSTTTSSDPLGISQSSSTPPLEESPPVYKRWWFWTGLGAVIVGGVVTGVLLSRQSAPQSPACMGVDSCVQ